MRARAGTRKHAGLPRGGQQLFGAALNWRKLHPSRRAHGKGGGGMPRSRMQPITTEGRGDWTAEPCLLYVELHATL